MAEQSPPFSATPLERPSRSLVPTSSHRRSASVACTRVLWNLISSAKAVRLHHEQAQKLCRVVSEKPTSLRLPVLAADVETTARGLTSSAASSPTTSTTASSTAVAAHHTAQLEDAGSILCVNVTVPQNVPLPLDEEPDIADMDTTSTRKRSRPSESGSDDEGGSRKMHAVAPERATVACLTPTSNDAVAHEDAVTHATDEISQSEFQTVLSKSKKRRQRASTSQGPAAHTGPRPATESTAMLAHVAPGTSNAPTATQTAPAGVRATEHTMPASASSSLDSGTILFRPANASASFHRTSRLAIAQALSALPGVKEVQAHRYLFFDKIATDNIQAHRGKVASSQSCRPTQVPIPASQCSCGASSTETTSQLPLTDDHAASERASTLEEHSAIALPLTDDEAEQMDSWATRKRAREPLGRDDAEDGLRKQPVTYPAVPELSNMGGDPSLRLEQTETGGGADPVDLGKGATAGTASRLPLDSPAFCSTPAKRATSPRSPHNTQQQFCPCKS
ncbi:hypothetical protein MRX96_028912 [Rhipicephalus microplus]